MVDTDEVERMAANARIELSDDEVERFADELDSILEAFTTLDHIDTGDVEPAFHPVDLDDRSRDDEEEEPLGQEQALANADNVEEGSFVGPRST